MAWLSAIPWRAAQPEPGWRLLQGVGLSDRKYGQRVLCKGFPPIVARFRSCAEADLWIAWRSTGKRSRTSSCAATSLSLARGPMCTTSPSKRISPRGRRPMSTTAWGSLTPIRIQFRSSVPPARIATPGREAAVTASTADAARMYINGFMTAPPQPRERPRRFAGMPSSDRGCRSSIRVSRPGLSRGPR
jgi:hypothetical protein